MSDSPIDFLPSHERQKLKRRMSPEAYEKLREKVKGPVEMKEEMAKSEKLAELRFSMETEAKAHEALKKSVDADIKEHGVENVIDMADASAEAKQAMEKGKYTLSVSSHPKTHHDDLVASPEGNVQEKLPVKPSFTDKYTGQMAPGHQAHGKQHGGHHKKAA